MPDTQQTSVSGAMVCCCLQGVGAALMAGAYFALPGGWLYEHLQGHPLGGPRYGCASSASVLRASLCFCASSSCASSCFVLRVLQGDAPSAAVNASLAVVATPLSRCGLNYVVMSMPVCCSCCSSIFTVPFPSACCVRGNALPPLLLFAAAPAAV